MHEHFNNFECHNAFLLDSLLILSIKVSLSQSFQMHFLLKDDGSPLPFQILIMCWTGFHTVLVVSGVSLVVFFALCRLLKQSSILTLTMGCDMVLASVRVNNFS